MHLFSYQWIVCRGTLNGQVPLHLTAVLGQYEATFLIVKEFNTIDGDGQSVFGRDTLTPF